MVCYKEHSHNHPGRNYLQQQRLEQSGTVKKNNNQTEIICSFPTSNPIQIAEKCKFRGKFTFLSKGAIFVPAAHGLVPVSPDNCQKPPAGGDTEPTTWPSTLNVIPVESHSRR